MKKNIESKEFLILLAGGAVVLIMALLLNYKGAVQKFTERKPSLQADRLKLVIMEGEETEEWETYRHEDLGFSIKHPVSIVLWRETSNDAVFTYQEYAEVKSLGGMPVLLQVVNRDNSKNSVVTALENETPKGLEPRDYRLVQINNAIGIQSLESSSSPNNYYLNDKEKMGPVVRLHAGSGIPDIDISVLESMISTFRFER